MNEIWTADLMNGPDSRRPGLPPGRHHRRPLPVPDRAPVRPPPGCGPVRRRAARRRRPVRRPRHLVLPTTDLVLPTPRWRAPARCSGIKLVHSQPGRPMGRGKIETVFQTIQQQFLVEVTAGGGDPARHPVAGLEELNDLLDHWVRRGLPPAGAFRDRAVPAGPLCGGRAGCPAGRRGCCARRSPGARSGWSARPPPSTSRATSTRWTRSWSAGRSSSSSTPST